MSRTQASAASQAAMIGRAFSLRNRALRTWRLAFQTGADSARVMALHDVYLDAEANLERVKVHARALRLMAAIG
jgi:hypothetical protein